MSDFDEPFYIPGDMQWPFRSRRIVGLLVVLSLTVAILYRDPARETIEDRSYQFSGFYDTPTEATRWVDDPGPFLTRLENYNKGLSGVRDEILKKKNGSAWQDLREGPGTVIAGNQPHFLVQLSHESNVKGVFLRWRNSGHQKGKWDSITDTSNLLVGRFYPWVGSGDFCRYLTGSNFTKHRWEVVYNHICTTDTAKAQTDQSLELYFLNALQINQKYYWPGDAYPSHLYTDLPSYILYVHVIQDGVATPEGDVYTANTKIIPYGCKPKFIWTQPPKKYRSTPVYDEVFLITQYWGKAFFHKNIEILPRISPYLQFLQQHQSVRIYVSDSTNQTQVILNFLGIGSSRFVGGVVRAKVLYLPQATNCGFANIQETQLLSYHLRKIFSHKHPATHRKKTVILIRRSVERHFTKRLELKKHLKSLSEQFGLDFFWFRDDPIPPLTEVMAKFQQAVLIVGPHGAGLSNMLFTPPGAYVIEGLCNPPHTNLCFMRLAHLLGHRYHAFISKKGCQDYLQISPALIAAAAKTYLEQMQKNGLI